MKLILKDGSQIEIENGKNGFEVAKMISESLCKNSVAYKLNDELFDMADIVNNEGNFELITKDNPEAINILNHSTSHLLAHAIKRLYPNAKFAIGPFIEEGFYYDIDFEEPIKDSDFAKIEQEMKKISKENHKIVRKEVSKEEALEIFKDNKYKVELINNLEGKIMLREQGDFVDLCGGNHVPSTSYIKNFKLLSLAGAYWRGDSKNKMLTRIYGTSFYTPEDLENHLRILEERKQRDHRKLGKELGLFMISDFGPGLPFWLPNGYTLRRQLEEFWINLHREKGYIVVETPQILSKELWVTSGHWDHYKEDMFITSSEDTEYAIKPMNCPGAILVYKNDLHSYKDLPLRVAELGHVHRNEASGALNGLFRVRTFTQDDAHTFLTEDQISEEMANIIHLYDEIYEIFGLKYSIELSTRPDDFIGDIEVWNKAEEDLKKVLEETGKPWKINPGDGAFYGPKLDFKLRDSMNRIWQCGTIQLDFQLPGRFNCEYVNKDGGKSTPVMIHRACFGSLERFIGIITENYGGCFPTWLAPVQVNVLPVNVNIHLEYAQKVVKELKEMGIRVALDESNEKLGYKLRQSQIKKIPFTLVIGDKEKDDNSVTYRIHGTQDQITVSLDEFKKLIKKSIDTKAKY